MSLPLRPLIAIGLLMPWPAGAQDEGLEEVLLQIEVLRREVKTLHARIEALEAKQTSATVSVHAESVTPQGSEATLATRSAELKMRWQRIAPGMTSREVLDAIGEPAAKLSIDGRPVWYYAYTGVGRASVMFDGGGRVSSLQAPMSGWTW